MVSTTNFEKLIVFCVFLKQMFYLFAVTEIDAKNYHVWYFLSKVSYILNAYEDVISNVAIAEKYQPKDANQELKKNLQEWKLQAYANSANLDKCKECIDQCNDLTGEFVEKCVIRASIELGNWDLVESKLNSLNEDPSAIYLNALYDFKTNKFDEAVKILEQCIQEKEEYVNHFLLLGELYRLRGNNKEALTSFLKVCASFARFIQKMMNFDENFFAGC